MGRATTDALSQLNTCRRTLSWRDAGSHGSRGAKVLPAQQQSQREMVVPRVGKVDMDDQIGSTYGNLARTKKEHSV